MIGSDRIHIVDSRTVTFPLGLMVEEAWLDGVEITPEQFYEKLAASDTLPSTSQINPDVFVQEFHSGLE